MQSSLASGAAGPVGHSLPYRLIAAPTWALVYVGRMVSLCQYRRPLRVVMATEAWFDGVGPGVDGAYFCSEHDDQDLLIIRESAKPTDHWFDVLAHEFAHALHGDIDRYVGKRLGEDETHRELVERFVPLLGGLVQAVIGKSLVLAVEMAGDERVPSAD